VRPRWLDRPQALARDALLVAGIEPGIVVFEDERGEDEKIRANCVLVRGRRADGTDVELYPPTGRCAARGFHPRLPPVHLALTNMLDLAASSQERWLRDERRGADRARKEAVLASLFRHFCRAGGRQDVSSISLLWYFIRVSYGSGADRVQPHLISQWSCELDAPRIEQWFPDESALLRFWGEPLGGSGS
jgi:hypothetical protein